MAVAIPLSARAAEPSPGAKKEAFDLSRVPLSTATIPAFPFIEPPQPNRSVRDKTAEFDTLHVIAGNQLRPVEGKVLRRKFFNDLTGLTQVSSQRNHDAAIKALGGVKIDQVEPDSPQLAEAHGSSSKVSDKLQLKSYKAEYDAYVVRTKNQVIWFNLAVDKRQTYLTVIEEKPMVQTVALVTAHAMRDALNRDGRVALYINFDTDKASIRPDGKPTVDEIAALLRKDSKLKLSVEGHTDNSGDAKRNKTLSQQRADAVMAAVTAAGIDRSRLTAVGHGSAKPLTDNTSEEGRAKNRRVELVKSSSN